MITTAGNTATHCAHCGRPCLVAVWVGSLPYHEECTRGPGYQQQPFGYAPQVPVWQIGLTEQDVRRIVREELAEAKR